MANFLGEHIGKLGRDLTETGYQAVHLVCLNCLASVTEALGDLDRVKRVVKSLGMVNSLDVANHEALVTREALPGTKEVWDFGRHGQVVLVDPARRLVAATSPHRSALGEGDDDVQETGALRLFHGGSPRCWYNASA